MGYKNGTFLLLIYTPVHLMGPLRFELRLPTPQAGRIPGYPTVPGLRKREYLVYKINVRDNHSSAAVSLYIEIV